VIEPKTPGGGGGGVGGGGGGSTLVVKDGVFVGPSSSLPPEIKFTTEGYTGTAEGYYAVVEKDAAAPGYSEYTGTFGLLEPKTHTEHITLTETGDYDVYVIIYKDGAVSDPLKINTGSGNGSVDWIWGDEPYLSLYVASNGLDTNDGDKDHPLATAQKALEKLAAAYAADPDWPEKGTDDELSGAIIILDTVQLKAVIEIDNTGSKYPPIILRDDPETSGGKLQATAAIGKGNSLLRLTNNAKAILSGGLSLAGTGKDSTDYTRGVVLVESSFIMTGGEISGNNAPYTGDSVYVVTGSGGGVFMDGGTFTMTGGVISGNNASRGGGLNGGGVGIRAGTFTMTGGEISGNSGDGVFMKDGTFTMKGGKISNNSGSGAGGVCIHGGTFTMEGGEISDNSTTSGNSGGGVYMYAVRGVNSTFTMNDGVISGNSANYNGGGVFVAANNGSNCTFTMNGGVISGNFVSYNGTYALPNGGGGVYVQALSSGNSTFTMNDGVISGNFCSYNGNGVPNKETYVGGGVFVTAASGGTGTFNMTNGTISGNFGSHGGGVYIGQKARFAKTGGAIYGYNSSEPDNPYNNKAVESGVIQNDKGHAIYVQQTTYHKETTVGSANELFYRFPIDTNSTGW
jgi:hypothetical protein